MARDAGRACAAVLRGSSILMVHHVHDGLDYWTLPRGSIEAAKTAAQAAVRELREETGLAGTAVRQLYQRSYLRRDGGEVTEQCYLVDVPRPGEPVLGSDPEAEGGPAMLIGVAWVPVAGLRDDVQVRLVLGTLPASARSRAKAP